MKKRGPKPLPVHKLLVRADYHEAPRTLALLEEIAEARGISRAELTRQVLKRFVRRQKRAEVVAG